MVIRRGGTLVTALTLLIAVTILIGAGTIVAQQSQDQPYLGTHVVVNAQGTQITSIAPDSPADTAGLRVANDKIEEIGIERTHQAMADSDLLVVVIDGSTSLSDEDLRIVGQAVQSRHVVAINKCDLARNPGLKGRLDSSSKVVHVSALT